jgi:integrase
MPKAPKNWNLTTVPARTKLDEQNPPTKPYWVKVAPGIHLGYRRNQPGSPGTWNVRSGSGKGAWIKLIAIADDLEPAAPPTVLDFWQAQEAARIFARKQPGAPADDSRPVTVKEALDRYETHLKARGGDVSNAQRPRRYLTPALLAKPVQLLTADELERWRDDLVGRIKPATVNRVVKGLLAALNLAARYDARIRKNRGEFKIKVLPGAGRARNVILETRDVLRVVAATYKHDPDLGLYADVLAETGARSSQAARLRVDDLILGKEPRLMMPRSGKGGVDDRIARKLEQIPVAITVELARRLKAAAAGRTSDEPLLLQKNGCAWGDDPSAAYDDDMRAIVASVGLPAKVTMIALRHSAIARMLLDGISSELVAKNCDTSVQIIATNYARYISPHTDHIFRRALPSREPLADNVVQLG